MYNQKVSAYGGAEWFVTVLQSWDNCGMEARAGWEAQDTPNFAGINHQLYFFHGFSGTTLHGFHEYINRVFVITGEA